MKWFTIEKFCDERRQETIRVPYVLLKYADKLLPGNCIDALASSLIDLHEVVQRGKEGRNFTRNVSVVENGIQKKILFSLE